MAKPTVVGPFEADYTEQTVNGITFGLRAGQVATFNEANTDFVISGEPDPDTTLTATNESNQFSNVVVEVVPPPVEAPKPKRRKSSTKKTSPKK